MKAPVQVHRQNQLNNMAKKQTTDKKQKGFSPILAIVIIVLLAIAGYFWYIQNYKSPSSNDGYSAIQNSSDLANAENDLDSVDVSQVDTELNQLDSDASTF